MFHNKQPVEFDIITTSGEQVGPLYGRVIWVYFDKRVCDIRTYNGHLFKYIPWSRIKGGKRNLDYILGL